MGIYCIYMYTHLPYFIHTILLMCPFNWLLFLMTCAIFHLYCCMTQGPLEPCHLLLISLTGDALEMSITSQEANTLGVVSKIIPLLSNRAAGSLIYLQTSNLNQPTSCCSGGQINRACMTELIHVRPDVMKSLLPKPEEGVLREARSIGRERSHPRSPC